MSGSTLPPPFELTEWWNLVVFTSFVISFFLVFWLVRPWIDLMLDRYLPIPEKRVKGEKHE